jgi:hypothetical protein
MPTTDVAIEISATCDCDFEQCDYGVPGSPVWDEPTNIFVYKIFIQDKEYTYKELCEAAGDKGADFIISWLEESIDHDSWQ